MKKIDKNYCSSSFLSFRYIADENINFFDGLTHSHFKPIPLDKCHQCYTAKDIDENIAKNMESFVDDKTAIMLSGGMDSAILAAYMPKGSKAYTMRCIADGVIDETAMAKKYADNYGLDHQIVDIYWEDYLEYAPLLMKKKGAPIHSIENQLYKVILQAQKDGIEKMIIGESADLVFGGMDKLLSKDWTFDDFVKRYTFVDPYKVLKEPISMLSVFEPYRIKSTFIDFKRFIEEFYYMESNDSYLNAFSLGKMRYCDPYINLTMAEPLDIYRIRNGEPKYLIRELFAMKYPNIPIPNKIPMPRAVDQWLANWAGPKRKEFLPNAVEGMNGDQKWLIFCLELFLNLYDSEKI